MNQITDAILITSGNLRQSVNVACWETQDNLEQRLTQGVCKSRMYVTEGFSL
jgi:hypothetical protein